MDMGTTEEPLKHPALPNEAPSPGLAGSMSTTSRPLRNRKLAAQTPTMPAPITATLPDLPVLAISAARSLARARVRQQAIVGFLVEEIKS